MEANKLTKICPNCKKENKDTAQFCQSCGTTLNTVTTEKQPETKSGINGWWSKQGKGTKIGSIVGVCCLGLLIIGLISAMGTPDQTTSTNTATPDSSNASSSSTSATTTSAAQTPQNVTISQLYSSSIPKGTYVKVTGKVLQSDSSGIRIENSDDQDILVEGSGLSAYEDQSVTVVGTYDGPSTYTTVMGGDRTVPTITDATIA